VYKKIIEFWMNERQLQDLQKPPAGFKGDVDRYLENLVRMENGTVTSLKAAEAERVKGILDEISALRRAKICRLISAGKLPKDALLDGEGEGLAKEGEEPEKTKSDGAKKILVRLLRDVPSFVGADLKTYGPLKSEDVVLLPAQNAESLVKRGIASEIQRKA
jgi:DNA replication initiation complex subunit (GINS family)